jgi:hypothetical protein
MLFNTTRKLRTPKHERVSIAMDGGVAELEFEFESTGRRFLSSGNQNKFCVLFWALYVLCER